MPTHVRSRLSRHFGCESLESRVLLAAGDLDPSFSGDGRTTLAIPGTTFNITDVAVQLDRKIVLSGYRLTGDVYRALVARLNADGSLDTSFAAAGLLEIAQADQMRYATGVAIQDDGKIVVTGTGSEYFSVARLLPNGSLDTSFVGDGIHVVGTGSGGFSSAFDLVIQRDGKIIAAGYRSLDNFDFMVVRFNPDGTRDNSFNGDGVAIIGFGGSEVGFGVAVDQNGTAATNPLYGTIVVVGGPTSIGDPNGQFAVARLTPGGNLDNSFDGDGRLTTSFPGSAFSTARGVTIQSAGRPVVGGYAGPAQTGAVHNFVMARYLPNGALDTSFGADGTGRVETDFGGNDRAYDLVVSDLGGIILAGASGSNFALAAYTRDGQLDPRFDGDGKVTVGPFGGNLLSDNSDGIAIANGPDRQLVVAGGTGHVARLFDVAPVVTISSTDPIATEAGPTPATFLVSRDQVQSTALRVFIAVGGTASPPGTLPSFLVDWSGFTPDTGIVGQGGFVDIPAGQQSVTVTITPVNDTRAEGDETAVFALRAGDFYDRGSPAGVTLTIRDDEAPDGAPRVTDVFVLGSLWSTAFKNFLGTSGLGHAGAGFRIPAGIGQLDALPWTNVNLIVVRFNQAVNAAANDFQVRGTKGTYNATAMAAMPGVANAYMFSLDTALGGDGSAALNGDKLLLELDGDAGGITGTAGSLLLDGDGNGTAGGDYRFRFNILQGDATRSGTVLADDYSQVKQKFFSSTTSPGTGAAAYSIFHDINGSGSILADDFSAVKGRFFRTLPAAEPTAAAALFSARRLRPALRLSVVDGLPA